MEKNEEVCFFFRFSAGFTCWIDLINERFIYVIFYSFGNVYMCDCQNDLSCQKWKKKYLKVKSLSNYFLHT